MTIAALDLLTAEELAQLRRRSDIKGTLCVAHAWLVIAGCMAAFALYPNPLVLALGIVIVGTRQLGLAILMHDAAHGVLTESKRLNVFLGQYLCAWPLFSDVHAYRSYHLQHHRHTQQREDPDLSLSAPFPITRSSFWRKMVRDLTGQTVFKQRVAQFRNAFTVKGGTTLDGLRKGFGRLGGAIAFKFHARDLHLVLGPGADGKPVRFRVTIDGAAPGDDHGADIDAAGEGTVAGERLYQLVRQSGAPRDRLFRIEFLDPGVRAYAFTFG